MLIRVIRVNKFSHELHENHEFQLPKYHTNYFLFNISAISFSRSLKFMLIRAIRVNKFSHELHENHEFQLPNYQTNYLLLKN